MKYLLLILTLLPFTSQAKELLNFQEFQKLSYEQQREMLKVYKAFVEDYTQSESAFELEAFTTTYSRSFFSQAFAAGMHDCFFGGWPSHKKLISVKDQKKTFCTAPPEAKSKLCGKNQMLCQPSLFGADLCVDAGNQAQRNSAFSQCQTKFMKSGKTVSDLIHELARPKMATAADELFSLVHKICSSGFQARTRMCSSLKDRVALIQGKVILSKFAPVIIKNKPAHVVEKIEGSDELLKTVRSAIAGTKVIDELNHRDAVAQCGPAPTIKKQAESIPEKFIDYTSSEPIDQGRPTADDYCSGNEEGTEKDRYSSSVYNNQGNEVGLNVVFQNNDHTKKNLIPGGYLMSANKIGSPANSMDAGLEQSEQIYARRNYSNSFLGRGKENSFEVTDSPIRENYVATKLDERFVSTDMRITQYSFFPRKVVPSVKQDGNQVVMKMTTGEEVVLDARTGRVVGGVGKEVPSKRQVENRIDSKGNKNVRTYPDNEFSYEGDALYVQSVLGPNLDQKEPGSIVPVRARVKGKIQECKLKSEDLWVIKSGYYLPESDPRYSQSYWKCTKFKFERDEDLYGLVKKACPKFQFPDLVK